MASSALLVATLTIALGAQADESRFDRAFDAAMGEAAPEFRPQPRRPATGPRKDGYSEWAAGDVKVSVHHYVQESPEAASKFLRDRLLMISIGSSRIGGWGDESYMVNSSQPRVWIRQGAVLLEVTASDWATLRRFARLFVGVVAASPQP